jgi:transcriptional regulator with XRE-family HTH domain
MEDMKNDNKAGVWLEKKMLDWQVKEGGRRTLDDFARFLGISRSLTSMLMNGDRTSINRKTAQQIAERLNDAEILNILGYTGGKVDPLLRFVDFLPPNERTDFLAAVSEIVSQLEKSGTDTSSSDTEKIISEIFLKFGVNFTYIK